MYAQNLILPEHDPSEPVVTVIPIVLTREGDGTPVVKKMLDDKDDYIVLMKQILEETKVETQRAREENAEFKRQALAQNASMATLHNQIEQRLNDKIVAQNQTILNLHGEVCDLKSLLHPHIIAEFRSALVHKYAVEQKIPTVDQHNNPRRDLLKVVLGQHNIAFRAYLSTHGIDLAWWDVLQRFYEHVRVPLAHVPKLLRFENQYVDALSEQANIYNNALMPSNACLHAVFTLCPPQQRPQNIV